MRQKKNETVTLKKGGKDIQPGAVGGLTAPGDPEKGRCREYGKAGQVHLLLAQP